MGRFSPNMTIMNRAVDAAAKSLLRDFGEVEQLQVSMKGPGDFVTAADKRAEKILQAELTKARPDYSFLMEESGTVEGSDKDRRWIIDPLDGTRNFMHGFPQWSISLALEEFGEITHAVVYDPLKDEKFYAEKGNGAFVNSKRIRVSGRKDLGMSMIGLGHPGRYGKSIDPYERAFRKINAYGAQQRRVASAALDLCYVAMGRYEGFYEHDLGPWDMAAGYLIVIEAGGIMTNLDGSKFSLDEKTVLAGNTDIHPHLSRLINTDEV